MRLVERDADAGNAVAAGTERAGTGGRRHRVEDVARKKLRRRLLAREGLDLVEIAVVQRRQNALQRRVGAADVDDDGVLCQAFSKEGHVDDEGRAVQPLRRPEEFSAKTMGDHDVVANFDGVHGASSKPFGQ